MNRFIGSTLVGFGCEVKPIFKYLFLVSSGGCLLVFMRMLDQDCYDNLELDRAVV